MSFKVRRREIDEWMDADDVDPCQLEKSLRFIRQVNSIFGYTRATLSHLERFSRRWTRGERIHILDVATGSADVPRAILLWARRRGLNVRVTGVDRHRITAATAIGELRDPRFNLVLADALQLPFESDSFDYVITSLFLHHLDNEQVLDVLRTMSRVARRGIIIADLLRHRRAYAWISLFTCMANPMVRHDARVSVVQAFTREEVLALRAKAGVDFAHYYRHFGHRFVLAGEKS